MKDEVDPGVAMECCEDINPELSKAIDLHDQPMKRLGGTTESKAQKKAS